MKLYKAIIKALTGAETGTTEVEEKGRFTVTKAFTCPVQPDKAELIRLAGLLPPRDSVQLSLHQATPICQISDIASGVDDLIEKLSDTIYQGEELTVKLQIDKDTNNGIISVYDYQKFSDYLAGLNLLDFLNFFPNGFIRELSRSRCLMKISTSGVREQAFSEVIRVSHNHQHTQLRKDKTY